MCWQVRLSGQRGQWLASFFFVSLLHMWVSAVGQGQWVLAGVFREGAVIGVSRVVTGPVVGVLGLCKPHPHSGVWVGVERRLEGMLAAAMCWQGWRQVWSGAKGFRVG